MVVLAAVTGRPDFQDFSPNSGSPIFAVANGSSITMPLTYVGDWQSFLLTAMPSDDSIWHLVIHWFADSGQSIGITTQGITVGNSLLTITWIPMLANYMYMTFSRTVDGAGTKLLSATLTPFSGQSKVGAEWNLLADLMLLNDIIPAGGTDTVFPPWNSDGLKVVSFRGVNLLQSVNFEILSQAGVWSRFWQVGPWFATPADGQTQTFMTVPRQPWRAVISNTDVAPKGVNLFVHPTR